MESIVGAWKKEWVKASYDPFKAQGIAEEIVVMFFV